MIDFEALRAPFHESRIHWRAQVVTKAGDKAMALAYIDSRDVRQRLNEVVGPENWTCEHYSCGDGRLGCRISIRCGDEWITKTDGAGETAIEAEKGAFSTALKRAAVAWGIGEYLYDMDTPWVPCESWEDAKGKKHWKAWKADPWSYVRGAPKAAAKPSASTDEYMDWARGLIEKMDDAETARNWWTNQSEARRKAGLSQAQVDELREKMAAKFSAPPKRELHPMEAG